MKSEKHHAAGSGKPLLHNPMPDKAESAVQRIRHPTLAIAIFRLLVPTESAADHILIRIHGALSAKRQKTGVQDNAAPAEPANEQETPQPTPTGIRLNMETLLRQVPKRLIIAVFLLAAAVITSLVSHQPPL
ncbi:TPA: hypothetical protein ACW0P3_004289 [Citrobacter freundii]